LNDGQLLKLEKFSGSAVEEKMLLDNICSDPRIPNLGYRMYTKSGTQGATFEGDNLFPREIKYYDLLRYSYQVMEFSETMGSPPHKVNFDFFSTSIDLKKGCFLGQELTARTNYNGVSLDP
jgi:folate-binding protein YgfZ